MSPKPKTRMRDIHGTWFTFIEALPSGLWLVESNGLRFEMYPWNFEVKHGR